MRKSIIAAGLIAGVSITLVLLVHHKTAAQPAEQPVANSQPTNVEGVDVTVLLDFSASFAPYSQHDQMALKRMSNAIFEVATKWWMPPVTLTWRRIGTSSLLSSPLCAVMEYSPKLTDGGHAVENLKNSIAGCLEKIKAQMQHTEGYTDISGAIASAAQARRSSSARKVLLLFSDFKEDQSPSARPITFQLQGETIVMVHRPGTDETNIAAYLQRVQQWAGRFHDKGAAQVFSFPLDLTTSSDLVQVMKSGGKATGTVATILLDFKDRFQMAKGTEKGDMAHLQDLSKAIAQLADEWTPPVTVRIGAVDATALRMHWMPPQVYQRTMIQNSGAEGALEGPVKSPQELQAGIEENIQGLGSLASATKGADLVGALTLASSGSEVEGHANNLIIVSDFFDSSRGLPPALEGSLQGAHVIMVYRPASRDAFDEQGLLTRIGAWQQLFLKSGAQSSCVIEMATLTTRSVRGCLGMN